jgi:hypothetical protein
MKLRATRKPACGHFSMAYAAINVGGCRSRCRPITPSREILHARNELGATLPSTTALLGQHINRNNHVNNNQ